MIKALYLDLEQVFEGPLLKERTQSIPHLIQNFQGRTISEFEPKETRESVMMEISVDGEYYGRVFCDNKENVESIHQLVTLEILNFKRYLLREHSLSTELNLAKDIDNIIELGIKTRITLEEILHIFFSTLRSYIPFETASIYLENKKRELKGLVGFNKEGEVFLIPEDKKPLPDDTVGAISFVNQKIFILDNPSKDSMFKKKEGKVPPKNLATFPLNYNNYSLGVLHLTNNLFRYRDREVEIINRYLVPLNHILFQKIMSEYIDQSELAADNLSYYVSKNVVERIKKDEVQVTNVDVKKKNIVCMFGDIRSFTAISETLEASTLVRLLNIYFEHLTPIVESHGGTIDKFVGDMISAFWNAPDDVKDPELKAVQAAIKMQKAMVYKVAPEWAKAGVPHMGVGIGIHGGQCIVGNVGSKGFNNYTVLGPVAEKAGWLESKARPAEVWISETMYNKVKARLPAPQRTEIKQIYKGKEQKAFVFKPEDYPDYTKK